MTPEPKPVSIQPTEQEQKALDFIDSEVQKGRPASIRQLAKAVGLKSSRSGHKFLKRLMAKGWVVRS